MFDRTLLQLVSALARVFSIICTIKGKIRNPVAEVAVTYSSARMLMQLFRIDDLFAK